MSVVVWFLPLLNVNNPTEINGAHLIPDAITVVQCERTLRDHSHTVIVKVKVIAKVTSQIWVHTFSKGYSHCDVASHRNRKNGFDTHICDCDCDGLRHRNRNRYM